MIISFVLLLATMAHSDPASESEKTFLREVMSKNSALWIPEQGLAQWLVTMEDVAEYMAGKEPGRLLLFSGKEGPLFSSPYPTQEAPPPPSLVEIRVGDGSLVFYPDGSQVALDESLVGVYVAYAERRRCASNVKHLETALEMWSTDHSGGYPASLSELVPDYLPSLPICPAAGKDTYSGCYQPDQAPRLSCPGTNHRI